MATSRRPLPPPEVESRLRAQFGDDVLAFEDQRGHAVITVAPERYREMVRFLRDEPDFACDYCDFTSAVDFGDQGLEVLTHLHSTVHHHDVRMKVKLQKENPACPSISDLFPTANWLEREVFDFYGVIFDGHPDLRRIQMPEDWEGHPLRKDQPLAGVNTQYKGAFVPPPDQRGV